jgi:dTMP kinase
MYIEKQGKLIVIEGLDGSGKTTQWEMLKSKLENARFVTFPDYESDSGKIIRQYLNGEFNGETVYSASSFYAVDRYVSFNSADGWGKSLKSGVNIVSARYTSSNAIYQMSKLPQNDWENYLQWLYDYEFVKLGLPEPDLIVFLNVPLEISQTLLSKRYANGAGVKDIHEGDLSFMEKCGKAAEFVARRDGWIKIECFDNECLRSPEDINDELVKLIKES